MTFFADTKQIPPDGLLNLIGEFRNDPSLNKIDLGVGVYQDETGHTPIFAAVQAAQKRLIEIEDTKSYLGPLGWPGFDLEVRKLVLGEDLDRQLEDRVATLPTPGSGGALKIAGTMIKRAHPDARIWLSKPTWVNHKAIFESCGLETIDYTYYDYDANGLDRQKMYEELSRVKEGDIVVVHGCCHNPTGEDLNAEDWKFITVLANERGIVPFADIAYQGLGTGFDDDLAGLRDTLTKVPEAILTYSMSKNMGLYRERVGAALMLTSDSDAASRVQSNLSQIARQSYSMPPSYGAALAYLVLSDDALRTNWRDELEKMRVRVETIRKELADSLAQKFGDNRFQYITGQNGMFSLLPLTSEQIQRFKSEASIYMAPDGRVNLCGFTPEKIERFTEVMAGLQEG